MQDQGTTLQEPVLLCVMPDSALGLQLGELHRLWSEDPERFLQPGPEFRPMVARSALARGLRELLDFARAREERLRELSSS
jgi:hypothetical protein